MLPAHGLDMCDPRVDLHIGQRFWRFALIFHFDCFFWQPFSLRGPFFY